MNDHGPDKDELREHLDELDRLLGSMSTRLAWRSEQRSHRRGLLLRAGGAAAAAVVVVLTLQLARAPAPAENPPEEAAAMLPQEPEFTELPAVANLDELLDALDREYPVELREAGVGGTTVLYFLVSGTGAVESTLVGMPSGSAALDEAAVRVAELFRFSPALSGDTPVPLWVQIPLTFSPDPSWCARCLGIRAPEPLPPLCWPQR